MMPKISLRLKLSDFINTDIEQEVMNKINDAHIELSVGPALLYLWFEEDELSNKDLKDFLMRWENKLTFKTVVKQGHHLQINDFIWFDIIPVGTLDTVSKRFSYSYINTDKILDGLQEFYNIVKFTTSEKPAKKQKRNDYEY